MAAFYAAVTDGRKTNAEIFTQLEKCTRDCCFHRQHTGAVVTEPVGEIFLFVTTNRHHGPVCGAGYVTAWRNIFALIIRRVVSQSLTLVSPISEIVRSRFLIYHTGVSAGTALTYRS